MADPVTITLRPGPGPWLRWVEWSLLVTGIVLPAFLQTDWIWKLAVWGFVMLVVAFEVYLAGLNPALATVTVDSSGKVLADTSDGDRIAGTIASPAWLCDSFCLVAVRFLSHRTALGWIRPKRYLVIAAANNAPDNYRIMRVWCRLQCWND